MSRYRIRGNDVNGWVVDKRLIKKKWSWTKFKFILEEDWRALTSDGGYAGIVGWFCFPCEIFLTKDAAKNFIDNHKKGYFNQSIINIE